MDVCARIVGTVSSFCQVSWPAVNSHALTLLMLSLKEVDSAFAKRGRTRLSIRAF